MKLVILIPAYNEELTLEAVIKDIRTSFPIKPFDRIEIVVINDGSTDKTSQVARSMNVDHVIDFPDNRGLGVVFKSGLEYCLSIGADVIVNTDADLQYPACEIETLVKPILGKNTGMVIGDRQLSSISGYPYGKLLFQKSGNSLISNLYNVTIKDSTSGFRAFSKETALFLATAVANKYTYTIETICILLNNKMSIFFVPIHIRQFMRQSRLIKNKIYYALNYVFVVFSYFIKRARYK